MAMGAQSLEMLSKENASELGCLLNGGGECGIECIPGLSFVLFGFSTSLSLPLFPSL